MSQRLKAAPLTRGVSARAAQKGAPTLQLRETINPASDIEAYCEVECRPFERLHARAVTAAALLKAAVDRQGRASFQAKAHTA